jgi:Asp-tRNA(Asn)/Glu-tRNA(Gln) amidotransferase B subunit
MGWFVGQLMARNKGKADPKIVHEFWPNCYTNE